MVHDFIGAVAAAEKADLAAGTLSQGFQFGHIGIAAVPALGTGPVDQPVAVELGVISGGADGEAPEWFVTGKEVVLHVL